MSEQVANDESVGKLISEFDVEETRLRNDMEALFQELASQGLIENSE